MTDVQELVIDNPKSVEPGLAAREEITHSQPPADRVRLAAPLESFGDCWPVLREVWDLVSPGGSLAVSYGRKGEFRLQPPDVDNLLRLTGFTPAVHARGGDGYQAVTQRTERSARPFSCTVVVPCRNEVGNVDDVVSRVPLMGTHTEVLFVDGRSTDGTPDRIRELIRLNPHRNIKLLEQSGDTGKAAASFQGFAAAQRDVIMILDADLTVRPEDLPRFYLALAEDVARLANGSRMIYPMAAHAMPQLNNLGNRAFSGYLSWLLGTRITDTLCGTKAILRSDVADLLEARPLFGGHDPWGDFDLLMAAAYAGLSVIDVPVRYEARVAGESKMRPMAHGAELAKTCLIGARRLKLEKRSPGAGSS